MTHEFKHPKYYAELRKERQAASDKQQAIDETVPHQEILEAQASSGKPQAQPEVASDKRQASSHLNPSLTSAKILAPGNNLQAA